MPDPEPEFVPVGRRLIVQGLSYVEDIVYIGLGLLLTIAALTLLAGAIKAVTLGLLHHQFLGQIITLLDQILLILLVVELLYTVQVSFREHGLLAEPFLVVALISVIRRILVLTAELPVLSTGNETAFHHAILELALLAAMVLLLVTALILLRRQSDKDREQKAGAGGHAAG